MARPFYSDCVGWRPDRLDVLLWLQEEAEEIDLQSLRKDVLEDDFDKIVEGLGYGGGLEIEDDYHVGYYREPSTGIVFIKHSAIEYVFAGEDEIEALHDRLLEAEFSDDPGMEA